MKLERLHENTDIYLSSNNIQKHVQNALSSKIYKYIPAAS